MAPLIRVWWLGLAMVVGFAACETPQEPGDEPDGSEPLAPSSSAQARLDELAERFQISDDSGGRPVIGEGTASAFEAGAGGGLRPLLELPLGKIHGATVLLPSFASGPVQLAADGTDVAVTFALRGAAEVPAEVATGRVMYRGALDKSDVVHRVTAEGAEDYIVFEERPAREELVYDVDVTRVAGLRLVSNSLEFVDGGGAPQLRVAPPYVVDAAGARHDARLDVEGCAVDTNASAPWGRVATEPGAERCEVHVTWSGVAYPAVVDPSWVATGALVAKRRSHTSTLLVSGKVLIAGGYDAGYLSSAELYDPVSGTFANTGAMTTARWFHTETLLGTGQVLVAAGANGGTDLSSTELYDPTSGTFSPSGSLATGRSHHTATLVGAGKVLVTGGEDPPTFFSSAELYDPAAGTFSATGSLATPRAEHTATLLGSGKVMVAGGHGNGTLPSVELYDPAAGTFAPTGPMAMGRYGHTATLLGSGNVLIAAGYNNGNLSSAELYNPVAGSFAMTGAVGTARVYQTATLLGSGKVLLVGGTNPTELSSAELFDPAAGAFVATASIATPRAFHTATLLGSGKVMVAGGSFNGSAQSSVQIYDLLSLGASCVTGEDCVSGFCADDVCCDVDCPALCEACTALKKGSGTDGTCGPVAMGTDPDDDCPADPATSCQKTGECNGASACTSFYPSGTECAPPECFAGVETVGACDDGGTCASTMTQCAPYVCGSATACATSCTSDAQCAANAYCAASICTLKLPDGESCTSTNQCGSGFCVETICCDTACTGSSCGADGKCVADASCNDDHTVTAPDGTQTDCTPYKCEGSTCKTECTSVDDCAEPNVCDPDGRCILLDEADDGGGDAGGCGCRVAGATREGDGRWLLGAVLGMAALARRRPRRAG